MSADKAREFAEKLERTFGLPTAMIDERLSTVAAQMDMRSSGKKSKEMKDSIDQVAAVSILEQGMNIERNRDRLT